ncbi:MAG: polysaccharide pyruvyl transferase family protein [Beduini sp.]
MKKIGIMSMQRIINYGSFLQAYGLKSMLEELGAEVEFVDYHPGECLIKEKNSNNKLVRIISKVKEAFEIKTSLKNRIAFIKYKASYTKKYLPILGVTETYNYNPKLDTLIIGSDEVFNCIQSNTNVGFAPELFGANNNATKLISYAGSFGNTTFEKIEKYGKVEELKSYFNNFNAISVRDENSLNVVKKLGIQNLSKNLDPVLMYDYINKCDKIPHNLSLNKPYIILYGYSGRLSKKEAKQVEKFAKENNKEILFLGGIQHCKGVFKDCNPFEVLGYFKNADCIITDTFHGTIFSIINQKNFLTIVRKSENNSYGNQEKLTDLLSTFNLTHRSVSELSSIDSIYEPIDYDYVEEKLAIEREKTYDFLKENI